VTPTLPLLLLALGLALVTCAATRANRTAAQVPQPVARAGCLTLVLALTVGAALALAVGALALLPAVLAGVRVPSGAVGWLLLAGAVAVLAWVLVGAKEDV